MSSVTYSWAFTVALADVEARSVMRKEWVSTHATEKRGLLLPLTSNSWHVGYSQTSIFGSGSLTGSCGKDVSRNACLNKDSGMRWLNESPTTRLRTSWMISRTRKRKGSIERIVERYCWKFTALGRASRRWCCGRETLSPWQIWPVVEMSRGAGHR